MEAQSPVLHLDFEQDGEEVLDDISGQKFHIFNQFNNPERLSAPFGKALRLDGHSTFINGEYDLEYHLSISDKISIEIWYATESFNAEFAALFIHQSSDGTFSVSLGPYGQLNFQIPVDGSNVAVISDGIISPYKWNHIVAQADISIGLAEVYLNGEKVGERTFSGTSLSLPTSLARFAICRGLNNPTYQGFTTSIANGAIDDIKIFNELFSKEVIRERYAEVQDIETNLDIDPNLRHGSDYLRPRYHFMPNTSWANEAYGFTYFDSIYHLFFQKNPNAPMLNFMHWGHMSSPDLVHWKEEQIPLRPQQGFSSKGVWSGTTFFDSNDTPVIAYTGVNGSWAGMGLAYPQDSSLITWEADSNNPIVERAPSSIPNMDFRDPYIFSDNGSYYMVVGSGKANNQGGILMSYKSSDLESWELIPPIFETINQVGGRFWEMPYFNKIDGDTYLFAVTPQYSTQPANCIYWTGTFENEKFIPYFTTPKNFEFIPTHMLSPAIGIDEYGQHTYIGIIPEDRSVDEQVAAGWRQTFSIPRVIRLLDDGESIGFFPHQNLCRARENERTLENVEINFGEENNLSQFSGIQSEFHFKLVNRQVDRFEIRVFANDDFSEYTAIRFLKENDRMGINRTFSSPYNTIKDSQFDFYTFNRNDSLDVRIFLDHSILEVFVDNLQVMSSRVYPSEGSNKIDLVPLTDGTLEIVSLHSWDIADKEVIKEMEVCQLTFIPTDFFTSSLDLNSYNSQITLYPNPSSDWFEISGVIPNSVSIYNYQGELLQTQYETSRINISSLSPGMYFIKIKQRNNFHTIKFLKM